MIKMKWEEILKVDYDPKAASKRVADWHKKVRGRKENVMRRKGQGKGLGATKDRSRVQAYLSQLKAILNGLNGSDYYDHFTKVILGQNVTSARPGVLTKPFENSILEFLLEALELWDDIPRQYKKTSGGGSQRTMTPAIDATGYTQQKYTSVDNIQRELWPDNVKQYLTGEEEE